MILERDGIGYEILVPGYAVGELIACKGQSVTLHTMEYYEGSAAGGNLIPRIVGFLHPEDRAFFERFITVKGIGVRKAIKALAEPVARVAADIEQGNAPSLARLPGIGKRAADQIIAELRGKLAEFAIGASIRDSRGYSGAPLDAGAARRARGPGRARRAASGGGTVVGAGCATAPGNPARGRVGRRGVPREDGSGGIGAPGARLSRPCRVGVHCRGSGGTRGERTAEADHGTRPDHLGGIARRG